MAPVPVQALSTLTMPRPKRLQRRRRLEVNALLCPGKSICNLYQAITSVVSCSLPQALFPQNLRTFTMLTPLYLAMKKILLVFLSVYLALQASLFAQDRSDKNAVTYEQIYDEPYAVNKLFVGLQPLYGELFAANVNAGFGMDAHYYFQDKADFRAHFRKAYSRKFFDFTRDLALDNSLQDNRAQVYNYFELGGTYHIKDFEEASRTKMVLYKKSYQGNRWASRIPLTAEIPCKVRKIYGLRAGGILWESSTDLTRAMNHQGLTNADLKDSEGNGLPLTYLNGSTEGPLNLYSNIASRNVYLGGSMAWIRNVAINFDNYEEGIDDLMFTVFFDLIYAPTLALDDVVYTSTDSNSGVTATRTYSVDPLKMRSFGARAGIDGRFNRTFSWAYGGEIGYRPSIQGRSFYALVRIAFPVFGSTLDNKVESFEK
jgi:hypothetical protein